MSEAKNTETKQESQDLSGYYTSEHTATNAKEATIFPMAFYSTGREKIYCDEEEINASNVLDVLKDALTIHNSNSKEIDYLYDYYKGKQPILYRTKEVRDDICNTIVENRANEIVSFKTGYLMGEPVQYVAHCEDETSTDAINLLNEFMFEEGKLTKDKELADWMHICGTAYRMVLPAEKGEFTPFHIYTLDPRNTFIVYSSKIDERPLMAVVYVVKQDNTKVFSIYTKDRYFEVVNSAIIKNHPHQLKEIPIIEYPLNNARLGAFEIVLPLLDAMNDTASNRQDGIDQFVQALMLFHNVDIDTEEYNQFLSRGAIKFNDVDPSKKGEIEYLISELNQSQTETLVEHQYKTILEIVGMPSMSDGSTSDSSNNGAVILRQGWYLAEARAKDTEAMFKESEKAFLKKVLKICQGVIAESDEVKGKIHQLRIGNIEIRFTRRNYENILQKAQVFQMLINEEKLAPEYAFTQSGLFVDPTRAYAESMEYYRNNKEIEEDEGQDKSRDNNGL